MTGIDSNPGASWQSFDGPEAAGWNDAGVARLHEVLASQNSDCLMVVQGGRIVFTHGDITHKFLCYSIRKSFLAAMIGEDVAAGLIALNATMASLDIDDHDPLIWVEREATVHDLLMARSGIYHPAGYETEWMQLIKEKRHSHAPGTFWCYNNWDFNALGTIFTLRTGLSVAEAFASRIAEPLGMQDFSLAGDRPDVWTEPFEVSRHPAYPFRMNSRDLARFGQPFLQAGRWSGRRVLPEGKCHALFRRRPPRRLWLLLVARARRPLRARCTDAAGSCAAQGAGGHYCMVIPELDMVLVHRVDTDQKGRAIRKHEFGYVRKPALKAARS